MFDKKKKNVLLTGGNGLLGTEVSRLLSKKFNVFSIVRKIPPKKIDRINFIELDLSTEWKYEPVVDEFFAIIHLAQSENFKNFPEKSLDIFNVNVKSVAILLDLGKRMNVKKFILASSGGVYKNTTLSLNENSSILSPRDLGFYLNSKIMSETLAENYVEFMDVSILRFFFIYGEHQKRNMLLPRLADNIKNHQPIYITGSAGISLNPIHSYDAAKCVLAALDVKGSSIYNIAGPKVYSLAEIVSLLESHLKISPILNHKEGPILNFIADTNSMKRDLHIPTINLEDRMNEIT